ncbi:hypothetical protein ACJJTC_012856 [Scirpophaga incertulas]
MPALVVLWLVTKGLHAAVILQYANTKVGASLHPTEEGFALPTGPGPEDQTMNSFIEFAALTEASLKDKTEASTEIMNLYRRNTMGMPISRKLLRERLEAAGAAVYDIIKGEVLVGDMTVSYMMAYSASGGFLPTKKGSGDDFKCKTPRNDPLVVMAEYTRVMLEDRTLAKATFY